MSTSQSKSNSARSTFQHHHHRLQHLRTHVILPPPTKLSVAAIPLVHSFQHNASAASLQERRAGCQQGTVVPINSRELNIRSGSTMSDQTNPAHGCPHTQQAEPSPHCTRALAQSEEAEEMETMVSHGAKLVRSLISMGVPKGWMDDRPCP